MMNYKINMAGNLVSIIIPTRNESRNIRRCLDSIVNNGYPHYEVILVDQESTDDTVTIAHEYSAKVVSVPKPEFYQPPSQSRNLGFTHSSGDIIYHIDADMELEPGLLSELVQLLQDDAVSAVIVPETDVPLNLWAKAKAFERSFLDETGSEAARASKRDVFERIMYSADVSSGEDWYIHEQFSRAGRIARSSNKVFHHIGRISPIKEFKKKFNYGKASRTYVDKSSTKLQSMFLTMLYIYAKKSLLGLFTQPLVVICFILLRAIDTAGLFLGLLVASRAKKGENHD